MAHFSAFSLWFLLTFILVLVQSFEEIIDEDYDSHNETNFIHAHHGNTSHDDMEHGAHAAPSHQGLRQRPMPLPWPGCLVLYKIDEGFGRKDKELILAMMEKFEDKTCLKFQIATSQKTYMNITKGNVHFPCRSFIGYNNTGPRKLVLQEDCLTRDGILHELMHALGFHHEHNRYDRDDHIKINIENIHPNFIRNFEKLEYEIPLLRGIEYDLNSITHYKSYDFAWLRSTKTIIPKFGKQINVDGLSRKDVLKVKQFYQCGNANNGCPSRTEADLNQSPAPALEPTESGEHVGPRFEGDMFGFNNSDEVLNPIQRSGENSLEDAALNNESKRVGAIALTNRWPQGKVYYKISSNFTCKEKCMIHEAMQELETKTCVTFTQDDRREDFIEIILSKFCASYVGRQGNRQHLFLAPYCSSSIFTVIHHIMYALGFIKESSRKDRDDYVVINWDNIHQYDHVQFVNHGWSNVTTYDLPYDYDSLMHPGPYAFAINEEIETIIPKYGQRIGQREKMSELDIERINIHYNCMKKTVTCIDTWRFCNRTTNLAVSCRNVNYIRKCQKTCNTCQDLKQNQHEIGSINCRKAEDRCTTWSTNRRQCNNDNQLKKIMKSRCYLSCQLCRP